MGIKAWWQRVFTSPDPITIYTVDTQSPRQRSSGHPFEQYKIRSLLGRGVTMVGDMTSAVGMVIDGHQKGRITMTGDGTALIVRAGGLVEGNVSSPIVVINGTVIGDVQGHFVRLYPGAKVEGAVAAKRLIVDDGAEINSARVGSGVWVAPALEHLPAVNPTAASGLPAAATEDGITDVPPAPTQAEAATDRPVDPFLNASPALPAQDWVTVDQGHPHPGAEVIQLAPTVQTPARNPPAQRTQKPLCSPGAAHAASVLQVEVAAALNACRGPPHHRIDGAARNGQQAGQAA